MGQRENWKHLVNSIHDYCSEVRTDCAGSMTKGITNSEPVTGGLFKGQLPLERGPEVQILVTLLHRVWEAKT